MTQATTINERPANHIPSYILIGEDGAVSPSLMQFFTGPKLKAVFGFSSKECYDRFIEKASLSLKPYPLTVRALEDQVELNDGVERMVVLDASGPNEKSYNAASINSVLVAQREKNAHIDIGFRLIRAMFSNEYRVERTTF